MTTKNDLAFDDFGRTYWAIPCVNCGCKQNQHRGGCESSPRHSCPRLADYGRPLDFPRVTASENAAYARGERDCFKGYDERVAHYWSTPTEFKAEPSLATLRANALDSLRAEVDSLDWSVSKEK